MYLYYDNMTWAPLWGSTSCFNNSQKYRYIDGCSEPIADTLWYTIPRTLLDDPQSISIVSSLSAH